MNTIGQHLRNIRQEKQISQEELAEKVFTTRQTISNYETGKSAPDLEMIEASKAGFLFRTTDKIRADYPQYPAFEEFDEFLAAIKAAL